MYIYVYLILPYVNPIHNIANQQMINPSQCRLSRSPQCKTWTLGLRRLRARTPEHQESLFSYLVIHPIIGILVLGVCVWGGYIERSLLMD